MPFTFAHPAASIPFSKKGLCLSALIVGSMVPDLDNLIPVLPQSIHPHQLSGLLSFDLPVGLLILFLFQRALKEATLALLPENHRIRLAPLAGNFQFFPFKRLIWILFSLLVGSMTHLAWDSFTHDGGFFVELFPILTNQLFVVGPIHVYVYLLFQNLSTIAGITLLLLWYRQWYRRAVVTVEHTLPFWSLSQRFEILIFTLGLAVAAGMGMTFIYATPSIDLRNLYLILRSIVVAGLGVLLVEWFVWGGIYQVYKKENRKQEKFDG